jgi:hypothetical protein
LLATAFLSTAGLWTLARVQPASVVSTPVPVPLLTPFTETSYGRLAADVARIQTRLEGSLFVVNVHDRDAFSDAGGASRLAALRITSNRVLMVQPPHSVFDPGNGLEVLGHDPASGLTLASTETPSAVGSPVPWPGESLGSPRYLLASDLSGGGLTLRPVFAGGFEELTGPLHAILWRPLSRLDLPPGTILFTLDGELFGVAVDDGGRLVVLPGQAVLESAPRLEAAGLGIPGNLGVEVQSLTSSLVTATGSAHGVVVTWLEPGSPVDGMLSPGDVVESWDGQPLGTIRDWTVRIARLRSGEQVRLGVRSRGDARELPLVAAASYGGAQTPPAAGAASPSLGLSMRRLAGTGIAVTQVAAGSAAFRAGLSPGDIVTRVGEHAAPTPQQLSRTVADAARAGVPVILAVTRAGRHFVTTLEQ